MVIIVAVVIAIARRWAAAFTAIQAASTGPRSIAWRRTIWPRTPSKLATVAPLAFWGRTIGSKEPRAPPFTPESWTRAFWTVEDPTFNAALEPASARRWAWRTRRRWRHVFVHEISQRLEFVFAQLVVFVLIKLGKQLFRLRQFGGTIWSAFRATAIGTTTTFRSARPIASAAFRTTWAAATAIAAQLAHFFAGLLALFVAELAIAIFVELFDHLLAPFGARAVIGLLCVFIVVVGPRRQRQQAYG